MPPVHTLKAYNTNIEEHLPVESESVFTHSLVNLYGETIQSTNVDKYNDQFNVSDSEDNIMTTKQLIGYS